MTETEYAGPAENYSLADELYGEPETTYADEDYDDSSYEAEFDEFAEDDIDSYAAGRPPNIEDLVGQGLAAGQDPYIAGAQARAQADQWWADWQAQRDYDQHVSDQAALADASEVAEDLIQQAAERHDVRESASNGRLLEVAGALFNVEAQGLYDSGEVDLLARLRSPEGAQWAIDAAAQICRMDAVSAVGVSPGVSRLQGTSYEARMRQEFDNYMRGR